MILRSKKEPLSFWRLQLFGWSLYAVYDHILYFSYRHSYTWHLFLWNTLLAVSGFLISTGMRLIYRRIRYQSIPMLAYFNHPAGYHRRYECLVGSG